MDNHFSKMVATALLSGFSFCANAQENTFSFSYSDVSQQNDRLTLADNRGSSAPSNATTSSSSSSNRGNGSLNRNVEPSRPINNSNSGERPTRPVPERRQPHYDPHHTPHHHHNDIDYPVTTTEYEYVYEEPVYTSSYPTSEAVIEHPTVRNILTFTFGPNLTYRDIDSPYKTYKTNAPKFGYVGGFRYDLGLGHSSLYLSTGLEFENMRYKNYFDDFNYLYSTKHMVSLPLMFGSRVGDNECIGGFGVGPRFHYGIGGECKETYDFASGAYNPYAERGVFKHDSYGGRYGRNRFHADLAAEIYIYVNRFFMAYTIAAGWSDCQPDQLYGELVEAYSSRISHSLKFGVRIF